MKEGVSIDNPNPGAVIAVQTFGDFLNFNSHLHIIATDGCFDGHDNFMVGTLPNSSDLEELFRAEVFRMLKKERKINDSLIENMMSWHNSGFNVYCGDPIQPWDQEGIERLAQYVNAGVLPLLNYTDEQGIFQDLDEMLVFDNKSIEEIKMNHLKTLICGGFIGANKLERFLLLKSDPLIKECGINVTIT